MKEVPRSGEADPESRASTDGGGEGDHPVAPAPEVAPSVVPAAPAPSPSREADSAGSLRRMLQTTATIIGPATLVSALAFYFGWVSTNATFSYFGLDASVLGLTVQDIILSSTDALFVPLGAIVVAALAGIASHAVLVQWADRGGPAGERVRRLSVVLAGAGAVAFVLGIWAVMQPLPFPTPFLFQQLSAGIGIAFVAYAVHIRGRAGAAGKARVRQDPEIRRLWSAGLALVWLVIALSVFWAVSEYAKALGRGRAQQLEIGLGRQPSVVVYAEQDLHLDDLGIEKKRLRGPNSAYRFRYSGLTFLVRSGGKYFLVPESWERGRGGVIALPDDEALRVEFVAGG